MFAQVGQDGAYQRRRVAGLQERRNGANGQLCRPCRRDFKTERTQGVRVLSGGGDVERIRTENGGDEQRLRGDTAAIDGRLEPFIKNAFMRCVHIDEHQAVRVLRQDVDAVQLSQRVAERRGVFFLFRRTRFRIDWARHFAVCGRGGRAGKGSLGKAGVSRDCWFADA